MLASATTGCLTYGVEVPSTAAVTPKVPETAAPRIEIVHRHQHTVDGRDSAPPITKASFDELEASIRRVLAESGWLANARTDIHDPEYVLELQTVIAEAGQTSAIISGSSLLLIPGFFSTRTIVYAELKSPDGARIAKKAAYGEFNVLVHILLLPIFPYAIATLPGDAFFDDTIRGAVFPVLAALPGR